MPQVNVPHTNLICIATQTSDLEQRIRASFDQTSFELCFYPLDADFLSHTQATHPEVVLIEVKQFSGLENSCVQEQINHGSAAVIILVHAADIRKAVFWMEAGANYVFYLDPNNESLDELVAIVTKAKYKRRINRVKSNSDQTIRQLNEDLDMFARTAAHDLKSPLQTIKGFAELLARSKNPAFTDKERDYSTRIVKGCIELQGQIESLLHFAQAGTGGMEITTFSASALIEELKDQLQRMLGIRQAIISVDKDFTLRSDRKLLSRILQNLLVNAIKYNTNDSPAIRVSSEEKDGQIALHINDNGVGIPESEIVNIFKPKVRLHQVNSVRGTGLGLATVERIAKALDIRIEVQSTVGKGTTMTLWMDK